MHNGKQTECLHLSDRGLQYGDGLFETIAVRNGQIEFWHRHMQRLQLGCQRLQIHTPDTELLLAEARELLSDHDNAVLKIIITRGQGGRGYRSPTLAETQTSRILSVHDWPDYSDANYSSGIKARLCQTRLGSNPALAGIKHLNRLEQVLAQSEWQDASIAEGLMLDINNNVIEGTMSNLFWITSDTLYTPDITNVGVAGVMREVIQEIARDNNIPLETGDYHDAVLKVADELFICNSLIGVWPVCQLEQQQYAIGPITQTITTAVNSARLNDKSHATI